MLKYIFMILMLTPPQGGAGMRSGTGGQPVKRGEGGGGVLAHVYVPVPFRAFICVCASASACTGACACACACAQVNSLIGGWCDSLLAHIAYQLRYVCACVCAALLCADVW